MPVRLLLSIRNDIDSQKIDFLTYPNVRKFSSSVCVKTLEVSATKNFNVFFLNIKTALSKTWKSDIMYLRCSFLIPLPDFKLEHRKNC